MSVNKILLGKGIKQLGVLVLLCVLSPITLTITFKAFDKFAESSKMYIAYGLLVVSIVLLVFSLYYGFKTFNILLKSIFNEQA